MNTFFLPIRSLLKKIVILAVVVMCNVLPVQARIIFQNEFLLENVGDTWVIDSQDDITSTNVGLQFGAGVSPSTLSVNTTTGNFSLNEDLDFGSPSGIQTLTLGDGTNADALTFAANSTLNASNAAVALDGIINNTFTLDENNSGGDVVIQFGNDSTDGLITWDDSGDLFSLSDALEVVGTEDTELLRLYDSTNTDSVGVYTGTGTPAFTAQAGSLFLDQTGSTYVNTDGSTTWSDLSTGGSGSTTLDQAYNNGQTIGVDSAGDLVFNLTNTQDFLIQDNSVTFASFSDTGVFSAIGDVDLGDAVTDTITFTSRVDSDFVPTADLTYNLGSETLRWANVYMDSIVVEEIEIEDPYYYWWFHRDS
jgi:hypothetical protein